MGRGLIVTTPVRLVVVVLHRSQSVHRSRSVVVVVGRRFSVVLVVLRRFSVVVVTLRRRSSVVVVTLRRRSSVVVVTLRRRSSVVVVTSRRRFSVVAVTFRRRSVVVVTLRRFSVGVVTSRRCSVVVVTLWRFSVVVVGFRRVVVVVASGRSPVVVVARGSVAVVVGRGFLVVGVGSCEVGGGSDDVGGGSDDVGVGSWEVEVGVGSWEVEVGPAVVDVGFRFRGGDFFPDDGVGPPVEGAPVVAVVGSGCLAAAAAPASGREPGGTGTESPTIVRPIPTRPATTRRRAGGEPNRPPGPQSPGKAHRRRDSPSPQRAFRLLVLDPETPRLPVFGVLSSAMPGFSGCSGREGGPLGWSAPMTALIFATHESARQAQGAAFMAMAVVLFLAVVGIVVFLRHETRARRKARGPEAGTKAEAGAEPEHETWP